MITNISDAIIRGGWQLTPGHLVGQKPAGGLAPILDAIDQGFRTFDCADIYTGVEALLGEAKQSNVVRWNAIRVHTKFVPDLDKLKDISFLDVQKIIDRSLHRLQSDRLDLVQLHWWNFDVPRHLEILDYLFKLKAAGKIEAVGLTNFDGDRLKEIINAGFDIASIQMQYSLLDRRGERELIPLCKAHEIKIFSYGSLLGGFLNESWLGRSMPDISDLSNRSLIKYKLIIDEWGGWDRYQSLLSQLHAIAHRHHCTVSQVAIASLVQCERVNALIVGLSANNYHTQNLALTNLPHLSSDELDHLWSWDCPIKGGVYQLERTSPKHSSIMKYNLNSDAGASALMGHD